jgi:hypothetical protein
VLYVQILIIDYSIITIIQFEFKIDGGYLVYQIFFITMPIYKKEVSPNQIIRIKFKRFGWMTKGAIIQVKKGINIRVVHLSPDYLFADLIDFANANSISITKTKDYRMIEK